MLVKKHMNHFNILQSPSAEALLNWNNNIQKLAERTRLGIPVTIATDPRHGASDNPGTSIPTPFFSKWCSPLGLAAINDTVLTKEFGDIARQEYRAVGIRLALSPMADLATEPRWGRINGTFGEDAEISTAQTKAYILGFQGDSLSITSVACMVKHFSGAGPQKDGDDAHFPYGKDQVYPGDNFDYHLIPFAKGAFPANVAQVMPYYGVPVGQTSEDVGFGYNKEIITGMLRNKYGFDGVVCTDWALISDSPAKPAAAYGVENLSAVDRAAKILEAGCDMYGGESLPELVIELVKSGKISEERVNQSVKRILRDKFRLGLFDNPYLAKEDLAIVGNPTFIAKGRESQRKSLVLLKNDSNILPLKAGQKIYVQGMDEDIVRQFTEVVSSPKNADVIILKTATPFDQRSDYLLERYFRQGRLDFPEKEKEELLELINTKPTITIFSMDRPPVIPEINAATKALIADFECEDEVILGMIFGKFKPSGKLPFELPSSVQAVNEQKEDVPYDSKDPLYAFGYGLKY
jgi:beta-glucosidase